jgi:hypothetical protein
MGTMTFFLPDGLSSESLRELERTCVAGGPDNMPWPTELRLNDHQLLARRSVDESGYLMAPWVLPGLGHLMGTSATLMERPAPYNLAVELARGKVNQVRCQAHDWRAGGLQIDSALERDIHEASSAFGRAVTETRPDEAGRQAQTALGLAYQAAQLLVDAYVDQVFQIRHQRQPQLDTTLAFRLGPSVPGSDLGAVVARSFNTAVVPLSWNAVEAEEASYRWDRHDALLDWAEANHLAPTAGPLIDFSSAQLPAWLWLWERDLPSMASFACKFVEAAVRRYRGRVRRWQLTAASNCANVLSLGEEELLGLTYRLAEAARQVDPALELVVGIAQPWGEYMASEDRTHSPFIFADTLIRSGLNLAALDVELVMGITPRGSYCRDVLEASRLLDLYALLGVPLRVTLGYPSQSGPDPEADPELRVGYGRWRNGFTPPVQAEWAEAFAALAVCKPFVQGVQWVHLNDAESHQFPHCGLVDATRNAKPVLQKLRALREKHLV